MFFLGLVTASRVMAQLPSRVSRLFRSAISSCGSLVTPFFCGVFLDGHDVSLKYWVLNSFSRFLFARQTFSPSFRWDSMGGFSRLFHSEFQLLHLWNPVWKPRKLQSVKWARNNEPAKRKANCIDAAGPEVPLQPAKICRILHCSQKSPIVHLLASRLKNPRL